MQQHAFTPNSINFAFDILGIVLVKQVKLRLAKTSRGKKTLGEIGFEPIGLMGWLGWSGSKFVNVTPDDCHDDSDYDEVVQGFVLGKEAG